MLLKRGVGRIIRMKKSKKSVKSAEELENDPATTPNSSGSEESQQVNGESEARNMSGSNDPAAALAEANDKYIRLYSEFDNYRRRTARERLELINSASKELIEELLPVLDDFERALQSIRDAGSEESIAKGVELIQHKLVNILEQRGLKAFESKEKDFDPDFHEAVTRIPFPELSGKVVDVLEKGYTLNEKVLRYAKVVVGE